jgi:hypothetical protein
LKYIINIDVAFSLKLSILVPHLVCAGTRGSVGKVETSTMSPGVDPASQAVLDDAVPGGVSEGPGEDPAYVMGSGCPPGFVVEDPLATLAVTIASSVPEVAFPAACREAGTSKSDASVVDGLNVVPSDDLALVGLSLAEVHPEVTQQGCAHVSSVKTPISPVEGPVGISVIPVGVSAVPAKEGESVKVVSAKGLLRWGILGAKNDSSSSLSDMKEVFSPEKGSKAVNEVSQVCSSSKKHGGYAWRVKEKFAKQVHENRELFTEVVADTSEKGEENYSEVALDALKFASNMGWTCGEGDEKSLLNLFSKIEEERKPTIKVKGKRELKNLECSINYEDKGRLFPERCHR